MYMMIFMTHSKTKWNINWIRSIENDEKKLYLIKKLMLHTEQNMFT